MSLVVAIVGSPNVGKSTLFNRISRRRIAITHNQPGVTRDRIYSRCDWDGKSFSLIDTGGIETGKRILQDKIRSQVEIAIDEAHVIIFVVDGRHGPTGNEHLITNLLRRTKKRVVVAVNKSENLNKVDHAIYRLGFRDYCLISSAHGIGIGDLLDKVLSDYEDYKIDDGDRSFKLAIIGKPNVGKSSIFNAILKEERSIVSEIPGTTRDSINAMLKEEDARLEFIDTAGISRRSKLVESVEHYALTMALRSLESADLALIVLAANEEITHYHQRVAGFAHENKKSTIILINKIDLIKNPNELTIFEEKVKEEFKFLHWAPIVKVSALLGVGLDKVKGTVLQVIENMKRSIPIRLLDTFINEIQILQPPPSLKGRRLVILNMRQFPNSFATFQLRVNNRNLLHFSYRRFIERKMREYFNLSGVAITIRLTESKRSNPISKP